MYVKYHGHSCFEIGDSMKFVFDPHDGSSIGLPKPDVSADVVFVTHEHFDHNAAHVVKGLPKVINRPGSGDIGKIHYDAILDFHDSKGGKERGEVKIYRVKMENVSFTHVGDLGRVPDETAINFMKNTDFLFIPVGSVYTINAKQAKEIVDKVNPRIVVPMHFGVKGSKLGLEPVENFTSLFPGNIVKRVGKQVEFKQDNLPKSMEVWVFNI